MESLLIEHYRYLAPHCATIPIPQCLQSRISYILDLRNSTFPRHFSNAIHIFLRDSFIDHDISTFVSNLLKHSTLSSVEADSTTPAQRKGCIHIISSREPPLLPHHEGISVVVSHPSYALRWCQGRVVSMCCQHPSNVVIQDGTCYFKARFPAKSTLSDNEATLVLSLSGVPVAHIQFLCMTSHTNAHANEGLTLITGLEVEEEYRGQGYARLLCGHVIAEHSAHGDVWVAADVSNFEAVGLYARMGFRIEGMWYDLDVFLAA